MARKIFLSAILGFAIALPGWTQQAQLPQAPNAAIPAAPPVSAVVSVIPLHPPRPVRYVRPIAAALSGPSMGRAINAVWNTAASVGVIEPNTSSAPAIPGSTAALDYL